MRAFVTGATGLLGPNLLDALRIAGHEVVALVRSRERGRRVLGDAAELVEGDLREPERFAGALAGAEVLIHAGASYTEHFAQPSGIGTTSEVNVSGTRALLAAAYRQGLRNVVYVSSAGVLKPEATASMSEASAYDEGNEDEYFQSKIAAEKQVLAFAGRHGDMRIVLILPIVMIGPRDTGPTPTGRFIQKVIAGQVGILLPGTMSLVDARDVATAIVAAIDAGANGERFVVGGRNYRVADLITEVSRLAGRPAPTRRPPYPALLALAWLMALVSRVTKHPPPLRLRELKRLKRDLRWNSSKAESELGVRFGRSRRR